jgi:hypothetical protein
MHDVIQLQHQRRNCHELNTFNPLLVCLKMQELHNKRLNEEARQNILHPSGRRYWSHDILLRIRQRMFSLSAMMALLGNYSYLNFAGKQADRSQTVP